MTVDLREASPGELVTFRLFIDPLREKAKSLVVTNSLSEGLHLVMTIAPRTCEDAENGWACVQADLEPLVIEIRALVESGTEGMLLADEARVQYGHPNDNDDDDEEDEGYDGDHVSDSGGSVRVSAAVRIIPSASIPGPRIAISLTTPYVVAVPGEELTFDIRITNRGTEAARTVSIVALISGDASAVSTFPESEISENQVEWYMDSLPVGVFHFLFNVMVSPAGNLTEIAVAATITYAHAEGQGATVQNTVRSRVMIAVAGPTPLSIDAATLPIGTVTSLIAAVIMGLFVAQRILALPAQGVAGAEQLFLLHRSGVVLRHVSARGIRRSDADIVGGMLAAVQLFVQDSVDPTAGPLREIRFGGRNLTFVSGENVILAAVDARGDTDRFADRAMQLLSELETLCAHRLVDFDGTPEPLDGIDATFVTLQEELMRRNS